MPALRPVLCALGVATGLLVGAVVATPPSASASGDKAHDDSVQAVHFAPGGEIEPAIANLLGSAQREVLVAMYLFTSRKLADSLLAAKRRGVTVRLIVDENQRFAKYSKVRDLEKGGVNVRAISLGKSDTGQELRFHHKFVVVDGLLVETGSFNWTQQADEQNWENAVIIRSKSLAAAFREHFEKAWAVAGEDRPRPKN